MRIQTPRYRVLHVPRMFCTCVYKLWKSTFLETPRVYKRGKTTRYHVVFRSSKTRVNYASMLLPLPGEAWGGGVRYRLGQGSRDRIAARSSFEIFPQFFMTKNRGEIYKKRLRI